MNFVYLRDHHIQEITNFKYLRTIIQNKREIVENIKQTSKVDEIDEGFQVRVIYCDRRVSLKLKEKFYHMTTRYFIVQYCIC